MCKNNVPMLWYLRDTKRPGVESVLLFTLCVSTADTENQVVSHRDQKRVPRRAYTLRGWVFTNGASKEWPAFSGTRNLSNVWNLSPKLAEL